MIKRLKWNVLFGEGAEDDSEDDSALSDGSDDSADKGSATVQAVLDKLARNDPNLDAILRTPDEASSSDEEKEGNAEEQIVQPSVTKVGNATSDVVDEVEYAEWRECQVCPGKRFLNDAEVELHLNSKRHAKAVRRAELRSRTDHNGGGPTNDRVVVDENGSTHEHMRSSTRDAPEKSDITSGITREDGETDQHTCNPERNVTADQIRRKEKRKAQVKRKLKALKRRKWEKQMQMEVKTRLAGHQKEPQKRDTSKDEKEEKQDLQIGRRQQTKGTKRERQDADGSATRELDTGNREDDSPKKTSKRSKKKRKEEQNSPQRKREELQHQKPKRENTGKRISGDGAERIRKRKKQSR